MNKSVLVIDDNLTICLMLKSWLIKKDFNVEIATCVEEAKELIKNNPFDLVLTDIQMPEYDGFALLSWVKKYDSDMVVIMMTGYADIESAVEAMKSGAADYISKPIEPDLLFSKIDEALAAQDNISKMNRLSNDFVKPPSDRYHDLFKKLDYLVVNNEHCLIIGDRGTGKSSALKYIYEKTRHPKPLEVFDVDTENSNLMDFKDGIAESSLMRKFKSIKGGLLCIKELSQLDIQMQNDLLSMLTRQSKGEDFTRLIVISEKQKQELKQLLIPKLYNVLECASVVLPTLKGKDEDILFFASHFIQFANHTLGKNVESIHPLLQEEILRYDWSGNIQELKNCMIKAVLISEGKELGADLISALFKHEDSPEIENDVIKDINSFRKENYEKEKIKQALELSKGNKTMAASILNIDRKTLYNKIKLYNVSLQ